jgi:hypothetical protein
MNQYIDYYYYELTEQDKKEMEIHNRGTLFFTCIFIKNGLIFNDIFDIYLENKYRIFFFCDARNNVIVRGIFNEFKDDYGQLYELSLFGNKGNFLLFEYDKYIDDDDRLVLYSKIPAWRDKHVELGFYIREVCKSDLPNDVIKYMLKIIKN